jgi:hypothetical protein
MKPIVELARWSCIEGRQRADDALFAGFNYQSGARHEKHRCRDNWQAQAFLEDERYWHGLAIGWVRARLGIERRCFVQSIVPRTRPNRRSFQTYRLSIGLLRAKSGCRRADLLVEPMERGASFRTKVDLRHAVSEPEIAEASQLIS